MRQGRKATGLASFPAEDSRAAKTLHVLAAFLFWELVITRWTNHLSASDLLERGPQHEILI